MLSLDIVGPLPEALTIDGHLVNGCLLVYAPGPGWVAGVPSRVDVDAVTVAKLYIVHRPRVPIYRFPSPPDFGPRPTVSSRRRTTVGR